MRQKRRRETVGIETVQNAVRGDADSINRITAYFQPYISAKCKRKFMDEFGRIKVRLPGLKRWHGKNSIVTMPMRPPRPPAGSRREMRI